MQTLWLGGTGRSGTTAALIAIGAHPDIYRVPNETKYAPWMTAGGHARWVERWENRELLAQEQEAPWMLEKSPGNVFWARELLEEYPGSKYLHVYRDREATIATMLRGERRFPIPGMGRPYDWTEAAMHYDYINSLGAKIVAELGPERGRMERIESLAADDIWEWLGLH